MNKSFKKVILILILIFSLFYSCSKNNLEKNLSIQSNLNNFLYDYTIKGFESNNYLPEELKNLLFTTVLNDGVFYTVFELLYPGRINKFNSIDVYTGYDDDCSWIDNLLMEVEEERIANEILEMENLLSEVDPIVEVQEEQKAEETEAKITEFVKNEVVNVNRSLSYMEYGDEKFMPQKHGNGYVLIHSYKDNVVRSFYDDIFRCYREENWKINSNIDNELISNTETTYFENTYIPTERKLEGKNWLTKQFFIDGLLKTEYKYDLFEDKEYLISKLELKYNKDDKIIESCLTENTYKDEKYSKLLYSFDKKYVYKYNNDDIPADFDYYENNILKMKNKYSAKGNYTSRIYFNDGYSVTTFYQDNKPIKEVFAKKDRVERVNNYEQ